MNLYVKKKDLASLKDKCPAILFSFPENEENQGSLLHIIKGFESHVLRLHLASQGTTFIQA